MRTLMVGAVLALAGCSTPLPCVFNDTPDCEARWQPVMQGNRAATLQQMQFQQEMQQRSYEAQMRAIQNNRPASVNTYCNEVGGTLMCNSQ